MDPPALEEAARVAQRAADRAREETLPRFRRVAVETKRDGSPVTEADRAAERAIREELRAAYPEFGLLGEEYGADEAKPGAPTWVIDPIDGTIAYSRGIPLYSTLIALLVDDEPVVGLIDLPALDERLVGWKGGGCWRGDERVQASQANDLSKSLVAHGDVFCFDIEKQRGAFEKLSRATPMLRGYTDAFGHALTIAGGADAMIDLCMNPWDAAATRALMPEAGGACHVVCAHEDKLGLVFGSPALCDQLLAFLDR